MLNDVSVAHLSADKFQTALVEIRLDTKITHHRSHHFFGVSDFLIIEEKLSAETVQFISVKDFSIPVNNRKSVTVTVEAG